MLVPIAIAVAVAIGTCIVWPSPGERAGFRVAGGAGRLGATILAVRRTTIDFRDGGRVELSPSARARVTGASRRGARVAVERGRAQVVVPARARTRWTMRIGPYQVAATGARFETRWDPEGEVFELQVREGRVQVTGPLLARARRIGADQSLRADVRGGRLDASGPRD